VPTRASPPAPLVGLGPALALTLACPPPLSELPPTCDPNADLCEGTTTSAGGGSTVQPTADLPTLTGLGPQTTAEPASTGDGPEPAPTLPTVLDAKFEPNPLMLPDEIDVTAFVDGEADTVEMTLESGETISLVAGEPGEFLGAFTVLSGLKNGARTASFTPYLGGLAGVGLERTYYVELAEAGEELAWNPLVDLPKGQVEALAVAGEHVIAFGTAFVDDEPRCYLYRHPLDGTPPDVALALFPATHCSAIDLVAEGTNLWVLAAVEVQGAARWRLARLTWGGPLTFDRLGLPNEVAYALARGPSGEVAVCGEGPSLAPIQDTLDGRVWRAVGADPVPLDYGPDGTAHSFDEHVRDCGFVGPTHLRLVGHAQGRHDASKDDLTIRSRAFLVDLKFGFLPTWQVAGPAPNDLTQSFAATLAIDDAGASFVGASSCDDTCAARKHALWPYDPEGKLQPAILLDPLLAEPEGLAWSPAGYVVLATTTTTLSGFILQAFLPGADTPAWTYHHKIPAGSYAARALALAPKVVVGGGFDNEARWALAFVAP